MFKVFWCHIHDLHVGQKKQPPCDSMSNVNTKQEGEKKGNALCLHLVVLGGEAGGTTVCVSGENCIWRCENNPGNTVPR